MVHRFPHPLAFTSAVIVLLGASVTAVAETRTWTDKTGKFKIEADFLEIVEGKVQLQRPDGKKVGIPLAKLSDEDQAYLREEMKRRRDGQSPADSPFEEMDSAGETAGRGFGGRDDASARRDPFSTGPKVGDRVEAREGGKWQPGVVTGLDPEWGRVFVKLDGTERTVEVSDNVHMLRLYDASRAAADPSTGAKATRVDLTSIRRVVPLGGASGDFQPDPAPAAAESFKPRPIGLNPKAGFFEDVVAVSFARTGAQAAVGHVGGAEPGDDLARIEVCDLKTGRVTAVVPGPRGLKMLAISPSGQRLITMSEVETFVLGPLQLWEVSGKELKHLKSWEPTSDSRHDKVEWIGWIDDERVMTATNKSLTVWAIEGPAGVYQITGNGMKAPAFSPGGKQFAIGTDKGFSIHDVASGEVLTRIAMDGFGFNRQVAFSPSGKLLAVSAGSAVDVYDATTGAKGVSAYAPSAGFGKGLCWLDEQHVLVGGSDLIHVASQMTVWTYRHSAESVVPLAGRVWYVFGGRGNDALALLPFQLPHPAVKPVADSELVLRPGDEVSIQLELTFDLGTDPAGNPISAEDQLKTALTDAGFVVVDDSNKKLVGRTSPGETKEIEYRMFGAPFGQTQKSSYTERVFELELHVDGEIVWQRKRVMGAPFHLQLKENESVDQAVQRAMLADTGFFRSTVPSRLLPTAAEKARTSQLSLDGIE